MGSVKKSFPVTGEEYCDPSCDIDNGGCDIDKICSLGKPNCIEQPCIGVVTCLFEGTIHMDVSSLNVGLEHFFDSRI